LPMAEKSPHLKSIREGDVYVVELVDRKILDEMTISEISEELLAMAAEAEKPRIVLDFTNVTHWSSSAFSMLITLHKRVQEKSGHLRLCCIAPSVYEGFVITRLNEVFKICPSRDVAAREAAMP